MAEVVVFGVVAADVILRVQRIPGPGDHVNAEALGWRIGGSSANVACALSTAGHHVRLVGPIGRDAMGDNLLAELEQYGVDTEYSFRADAASPRTLILLDGTGERTIIAVDSGAGPSSFLPVRAGSQVSRLRLHRGLRKVASRYGDRGRVGSSRDISSRAWRNDMACDRRGWVRDAIPRCHPGRDV
jgi:pfkB family carbohydrate kinase